MVAKESGHVLDRGDEAPSFELRGTDEQTHTLADFDDSEALLLVFTCNHCPYAKAKEEALNTLAAEYDDVAVVGINPNDDDQYPDDSFEKMQAYVESGRIGYDAYLHDESQAVAAAYGAVCTPDPFLFRNDGGTFRLAYHGRLDDALNPDDDPSGDPAFEMRRAIEEVLAVEDVTVEWNPSRGCSIKWRTGNEPDYWSDV
ncbi:thioredoxin family protein [Salinigranum salinum]|uniref:thioredoxin family protein n=1 Tax=Salinigranum salinum TaxID=1364937 RepID=UPI001260B5FA|nr:thioredoxin family protein [Salinigranum salinum]